jgi:hypothetical protein
VRRAESLLKRAVAVGTFVQGVLHSVLLTVFVGLVFMMLAAWLGAGWPVILSAAVLGLIAGGMLSARVCFAKEPPAAEPVLQEWRYPGVQDRFERVQARQRVLVVLLVVALLAVCGLYFVPEKTVRSRFGVPGGHLLAGVLAAMAVVIPLALINWRCPHCRLNLGRGLSLRQCPHCGVVLRG